MDQGAAGRTAKRRVAKSEPRSAADLAREVARLRKALVPFVRVASCFERGPGGNLGTDSIVRLNGSRTDLTVSDFWAVADALKRIES